MRTPDDSTPGETPPSSNGLPSENIPPVSDKIPPMPEDTPPSLPNPPSENIPPLMGDTPAGPEYPPATISEGLRAELRSVWLIGFLDAMKGEPVNDDDEILSSMAEPLVTAAETCIDSAAPIIAAMITENPTTVFETVYQVGYDLCAAMNAAYRPIEINLN